MKTIILDGEQIQNMSEIHRIFSETLNFPSWYGRNLDALHDCLSEVSEDVSISITNREALIEKLQRRYSKLIKLLIYSAEENEHLHLNI